MFSLSRIKPAAIPVIRHASDYSDEEYQQVEIVFKRRLEKYRAKESVLGFFAVLMVFAPLIITLILEQYIKDQGLNIFAISTFTILAIYAFLIWLLDVTLTCPGCSNVFITFTNKNFESYCPECSNRDVLELRNYGWFGLVKCVFCTVCDKYLHCNDEGGCSYEAHTCTYCGLRLSDEDLCK